MEKEKKEKVKLVFMKYSVLSSGRLYNIVTHTGAGAGTCPTILSGLHV